MQRVRTFSWEAPVQGAAAAGQLSGIEYLRSVMKGERPGSPVMAAIGFRLIVVEPGEVAFEFEPAEYHYNLFGSVHGGVVSTLLDSAMSSCIHSLLPAGTGSSTLEIKVNFVRRVTEKVGTLRAEAKALHAGARIATAMGRLIDRQGRLYAHSITTCMMSA